MSAWLVLPVKSIADGKSRLAPHLAGRARRGLNRELLGRSLALAARYPGADRTVVISRCPEVLATARARGMVCLLEEGTGLNEAVQQALDWVRHVAMEPVLVLSCDLPFASEDDLRALVGHDGVVLATDREGSGTNGLYLPAGAPFRFYYGLSSRQRHAAEAARLGLRCRVMHCSSLAFDLDTFDDWREWRRAEGVMAKAPPKETASTVSSAIQVGSFALASFASINARRRDCWTFSEAVSSPKRNDC